MKQIKIFDTTLRDGEQSPGCSMNLAEKIEIAKQLERLKIDVIEAGFAASSPGDFESVMAIAGVMKDVCVASLSRCEQSDIDASWQALKNAISPRIHIVLATSPIHMEYKLKMTPEQVLDLTVKSVKYAKRYCPDVEFSAEDAMRSDPEFLAKITYGAIAAGATVVNIPDTVGIATPDEMRDMFKYLFNNVSNIDKAQISTHCHNDLGMAVANSLAAMGAGATQLECTINGLGERAGNAALEEIVMAIKTRKTFFNADCRIDTRQIYRTSKLVYNIIGQTVPLNKAIVGDNAFSHEAGIHQHGVLKKALTYEIMTPESIGISKSKIVLGKHSGRHAFSTRLEEMGYYLTKEELNAAFERFKELCDKKKEVTDKDLEAIVSNRAMGEKTYTLEKFDVRSSNFATATCVISLKKEGEGIIEELSAGDGPIDAAYNAIDKIIKMEDHVLEDYAIHSISDGKDALGEVMVKIKYKDKIYSGRGLSMDIIESSILAYLNAINKILNLR